MKEMMLKDLRKGEFFTLKPVEEPDAERVYVRGDYDRSLKKFECPKFVDILGNGRMIKGTTKVYTEFTF